MIAFLPRRQRRERTVEERIARGQQAERLLADDSVLTEALERATQRALDEWADGDGGDGVAVHAVLRAFKDVQRSLKVIMDDGTVARTSLYPSR